MSYKQFCPISKAMEVLGERWTLLVIRELLMGSTRFNQFQRGLSQISPTLLTKRLAHLEEEGLLVKKRISGQRGYEYLPTQACLDLTEIVEQLGFWGLQWTKHRMREDDYDLELLMLYLERAINTDAFPGNETTIRFSFSDATDYPNWWILIKDESVEVCTKDPGNEVDVYFNTTVKTMTQVWMGERSYKNAIKEGALELIGPRSLVRRVDEWLRPSLYAGIQPAKNILHSD